MKVPLIYEGLHEFCELCGSESHQIEACPNLPPQFKVEIVVEKFEWGSGQAAVCMDVLFQLWLSDQGKPPCAGGLFQGAVPGPDPESHSDFMRCPLSRIFRRRAEGNGAALF